MTIAEREQLAASASEPMERRWTRAEYLAMGEQGYFDGQRVQLLDGKVYVMAPQGEGHSTAVELVADALRAAFGSGYRLRMQLPVVLNEWSEPEPDVSVVTGKPRDGKPRTGLLFVEVADSSLTFDRTKKAPAYAAVGVPEYWIVCLRERTMEVHREPVDGRYRSVVVYKAGERIAPMAKPEATLAVDDLLP